MDETIYNKILKLQIREKRVFWIKAYGTSMEPLIKSNSKICISTKEEYGIGDIILFEEKDEFILHRLLFIDSQKDIYITFGDNTICADKSIKGTQIIGKATKIIEKPGCEEIVKKYSIYNRVTLFCSKVMFLNQYQSRVVVLCIYIILKIVRNVMFWYERGIKNEKKH